MLRNLKIEDRRASKKKPSRVSGLKRLSAAVAVVVLAATAAAAQNPSAAAAQTRGTAGDEFNAEKLSAEWQWRANAPRGAWAFMFPARGVLRMNSVQTPEKFRNLRDAPNLLMRKFPAAQFTATAKITLAPRFEGEKFGLLVMSGDYAYIGVAYKGGKMYIAQASVKDAEKGSREAEGTAYLLSEKTFYLRVKVENAGFQFAYSTDGAKFTNLGIPVKALAGGADAKIGLFFTRPGKFNDAGSADVDWFRIE